MFLSNIELEKLKSDAYGAGNAARQNTDDLDTKILQAAGVSLSFEEEILKFIDPTIGGFWNPRYGDFLSAKDRQAIADAVDLHFAALKKADPEATIEDAIDDVLESIGFGQQHINYN